MYELNIFSLCKETVLDIHIIITTFINSEGWNENPGKLYHDVHH